MITAEQVREYLRIPYADDDSFIERIIKQGYDYLKDAIDDYDELYRENQIFSGKCDMWVLTHWTPGAYDQREGMFTGKPEMDYAARAMITQLQLYRKDK